MTDCNEAPLKRTSHENTVVTNLIKTNHFPCMEIIPITAFHTLSYSRSILFFSLVYFQSQFCLPYSGKASGEKTTYSDPPPPITRGSSEGKQKHLLRKASFIDLDISKIKGPSVQDSEATLD